MASLPCADDEEELRRNRLVMLDVDVVVDAAAAVAPAPASTSTDSVRPCSLCFCCSNRQESSQKMLKRQMRWRRQINEKDNQEEIHLFKYNEVPDFLKINPYILYGYRSLLPLHLCIKSIFVWSNETINIWSHLLGCLIFIVLLPYDNLYTIPKSLGTLADHIVCSVSLICYQICMICSAGYHVFYCHSPQANVRWLAFDLSGIVVGLMGCYIPGVHYAFYCVSRWENIYLFSVIVLSLIILTIQLNPKRLSDSIAFTISRVLMYTFLACYGIIPSAHWFYMNGGWQTEIVRVFIPKLVYMYLIGLGAIFFYLFHFPERLSPGYFDIVGASHQIWHIFIFLSLIWWRKSYLEVLEYRTSNVCK